MYTYQMRSGGDAPVTIASTLEHCGEASPPRRRDALFMLAALMSIMSVALLLQLNTYPNHDVAWVLWGTRELLMGAKWGIDVIEPNPPLIYYLSMPSTAVAMWLSVPLDWTFRIAVALSATVAAGSFGWLLRGADSKSGNLFLCFMVAACLLLLPGREFGQREHLLAIAIIPYLALANLRIGQRQCSAMCAVTIGIAAGLGIALKPYFLAVPFLVEVAVQVLSRRRIALFRAENLALGSVMIAYAIYLLAFELTYLRQVVPMANEIYWSFNLPMAQLWPPLVAQLLPTVPFMAYSIYRRDPLGIMLSAALCGLAVSYLVQHKGYPYHLLPISIISLILVANFVTAERVLVRAAAMVALFALAFVCFRPALAWWQVNKPGGARTAEIDSIRDSIETHAQNRRFLVVAVHPYPTFPVAIYTTAHQVSRTNSHWFLPAVFQLRGGKQQHSNLASIERHAREFIDHDLAADPDVVLIDRNSGRHTVGGKGIDFLDFYQEDPAFRRAWHRYREIKPIGDYRQFVRVHPESGRPQS